MAHALERGLRFAEMVSSSSFRTLRSCSCGLRDTLGSLRSAPISQLQVQPGWVALPPARGERRGGSQPPVPLWLLSPGWPGDRARVRFMASFHIPAGGKSAGGRTDLSSVSVHRTFLRGQTATGLPTEGRPVCREGEGKARGGEPGPTPGEGCPAPGGTCPAPTGKQAGPLVRKVPPSRWTKSLPSVGSPAPSSQAPPTGRRPLPRWDRPRPLRRA